MEEIETCVSCGVPLMVSSGQRWGGNGVITLAMSPRNRMVFYESENIDDLFRGIEQLVGVPIEHIVIESRRRETRKYIERVYGAVLKGPVELARESLKEGKSARDSAEWARLAEVARQLNLDINNIGRVYGYGGISLGGGWEGGEDFPWRTQIVREPYSLPLYAADLLGSVEAVEGSELWVEYGEIGEGVYRFTAYPSEHPVALAERLQRKRYEFKPGDIEFERCPACGVPEEVGRCRWDLEAGIVTDPESGRRMALFGPGSLDAILGDLEAELGEAIPETVIAAQKRYIKEHVSEDSWKKDAGAFRRMIAARGLGNLTRFEGDRRSLSVTIENACLHLLMVGTTQGMVELVYGVEESRCAWGFAPEGELAIQIEVR